MGWLFPCGWVVGLGWKEGGTGYILIRTVTGMNWTGGLWAGKEGTAKKREREINVHMML